MGGYCSHSKMEGASQNSELQNIDGTCVEMYLYNDPDNPSNSVCEYKIPLKVPPVEYQVVCDMKVDPSTLPKINPAPGMGRTGNPQSENAKSLDTIRNHPYYYIVDPRTPPVEVNSRNFKNFLKLFHDGLYPYNQRLHGGLKICTFCWSFISRKTRVEHEEIAPTDIPPEYTLAEAVGKTDDDPAVRLESFQTLGQFLEDNFYRPLCSIDLDSLIKKSAEETTNYKYCPPYFKPVHAYTWSHCFPKFIVSLVPHRCYQFFMGDGPGTDAARLLRGRMMRGSSFKGKTRFQFLKPIASEVSAIKNECEDTSENENQHSKGGLIVALPIKKKPNSKLGLASSSSHDQASKLSQASTGKKAESRNANFTNKKPAAKPRAKKGGSESQEIDLNTSSAEIVSRERVNAAQTMQLKCQPETIEPSHGSGSHSQKLQISQLKEEAVEDCSGGQQVKKGNGESEERTTLAGNAEAGRSAEDASERSSSQESSKSLTEPIRTDHLETEVSPQLRREYPSLFHDGVFETSLVKKTLMMVGVHSLVVITPHKSKPIKIDVLNSKFFSNRSHLDAGVVSAWAKDIVETGRPQQYAEGETEVQQEMLTKRRPAEFQEDTKALAGQSQRVASPRAAPSSHQKSGALPSRRTFLTDSSGSTAKPQRPTARPPVRAKSGSASLQDASEGSSSPGDEEDSASDDAQQ